MTATVVPTRRITAGTRILALLGLSVTLLLVGDLLIMGMVAVLPADAPWLLVWLIGSTIPFAVAWLVGTQAGRSQWWEAAIAAGIAGVVVGLIRETATIAWFALMSGGGISPLQVLLRISLGAGVSPLALAIVVLGAFLGARRTELPSERAGSRAWRRVGFACLLAPAVLLIVAALLSTLAPRP